MRYTPHFMGLSLFSTAANAQLHEKITSDKRIHPYLDYVFSSKPLTAIWLDGGSHALLFKIWLP